MGKEINNSFARLRFITVKGLTMINLPYSILTRFCMKVICKENKTENRSIATYGSQNLQLAAARNTRIDLFRIFKQHLTVRYYKKGEALHLSLKYVQPNSRACLLTIGLNMNI